MDEWISVKDKLPELKKGVGELADNSGYVKVIDNKEIRWGIYFENGNWIDALFLTRLNKCKYENGLLQKVTKWKYADKLPKGAIKNTIVKEQKNEKI